MSRLAAIALGSNLSSIWGDREATLRQAVARVARLGELRAVSSFYDTAPVGYADQPRFLNGALLLATDLEPLSLLRSLLAIEQAMGRDRSAIPDSTIPVGMETIGAAPSRTVPIKGPRVIDLDLLLIDDVVLDTTTGSSEAVDTKASTELTLPHPTMAERRFVLEPLAEIAPSLIDPRSGRTIAELLAQLSHS